MDFLIQTTIDLFNSNAMRSLAAFLSGSTVEHALQYLADNQILIFGAIVLFLCFLSFLNSLIKIIANGVTNKRLALLATERPRILNEGSEKRILLLGDSTGYGTGASSVEETMAGRFAHDFPHVEVNNYAVNGSLTENVIKQLEHVHDRNYNLTIISTGGNDTWHFTSMQDIERDLRTALSKAMEITGKNVVLIIYNNLVSGPIFPFFVRGRILRRTILINEIFMRVGNELGIETVPIFLNGEKCPKDFFARDGLHPSSEGYRIMYIRLWAKLYQKRYDFHLRDYL